MEKLTMEVNSAFPCDRRNFLEGRTQPVRYLVVHYVGASGSARNNAKYYATSRVLASAHYFVGHADEGAAVYQSVLEEDTAWHCGRSDGKYLHADCRNANSIGIELCCHQDKQGKWYFDPQTVEKAQALIRELMERYQITGDRVLRHYDVTGKVCPAPFVERASDWVTFLTGLSDPLAAAVDKLAARGILNSPAYWKGGCYTAQNVEALLIKCAAAL